MPIGPFLSALGQAFQGYGQDQRYNQQQESAADAADRQQQENEFYRRLALAKSGYVPVASGQPAPSDALSVPFGDNTQSYTFDYDRSPEGIAQKRMLAENDARALSAQNANDRKTLLQQKRDYNTLRAEFPNDPLAKQAPDWTNVADYTTALATARDLRKQQAVADLETRKLSATKTHWIPAGVDKQTGQPVVLNTDTGETKVGGGVKEQGGMGGSLGMGGPGRAASQLAGMKGYIAMTQQIRPFEQQVHDGIAPMTGWNEFEAALRNMKGGSAHNVTDHALMAGTVAHINRVNPALGNYLAGVDRLISNDIQAGSGAGGSDYKAHLDEVSSRIRGGMDPAGIEQLWADRDAKVEAYGMGVQALEKGLAARAGVAMPGGGGAPGGPDIEKARTDPAYRLWLKRQGVSVP